MGVSTFALLIHAGEKRVTRNENDPAGSGMGKPRWRGSEALLPAVLNDYQVLYLLRLRSYRHSTLKLCRALS